MVKSSEIAAARQERRGVGGLREAGGLAGRIRALAAVAAMAFLSALAMAGCSNPVDSGGSGGRSGIVLPDGEVWVPEGGGYGYIFKENGDVWLAFKDDIFWSTMFLPKWSWKAVGSRLTIVTWDPNGVTADTIQGSYRIANNTMTLTAGRGVNREQIVFTKVKIAGGDSKLEGDWLEESGRYFRKFITFKPSGRMCYTEMYKVGGVWLSSERYRGQWLTDGQNLHVSGYGGTTYTYDISGSNLTLIERSGGDFHSRTAVKSDIASVKRELGTVYSGDTALAYSEWSRGKEQWMEFWGPGFYEWGEKDNYYIGEEYGLGAWYTIGSRLFLLGASEDSCLNYDEDEGYGWDCSTTIEKMVQFEYRFITGGDSEKWLAVRRVLENGALGQEEVWMLENGGYWWSPAEPGQRKQIINRKSKGARSRLFSAVEPGAGKECVTCQ